jgi:hypothetical protein
MTVGIFFLKQQNGLAVQIIFLNRKAAAISILHKAPDIDLYVGEHTDHATWVILILIRNIE